MKIVLKGEAEMLYNTKTSKEKTLRIWITIIRHGGLGHEVEGSWPYLSSATPWPYELSHVKNEFSLTFFSPPPPLFPSRARLIFALLVLISPHCTI